MKRIARIAVLLSAAAFCMAAGVTNAGAATGGQVSLDNTFRPGASRPTARRWRTT